MSSKTEKKTAKAEGYSPFHTTIDKLLLQYQVGLGAIKSSIEIASKLEAIDALFMAMRSEMPAAAARTFAHNWAHLPTQIRAMEDGRPFADRIQIILTDLGARCEQKKKKE